jgi:hypothetical protein
MGFRFRRSLRIAPGLRLNVGKRGASISVGPRGAKLTVGPQGTRVTAGLPGTGLSMSQRLSSSSHSGSNVASPNPSGAIPVSEIAIYLLLVVGLILIMAGATVGMQLRLMVAGWIIDWIALSLLLRRSGAVISIGGGLILSLLVWVAAVKYLGADAPTRCRDGTTSYSRGSGACSGHGGVAGSR